MRLVDIDEVYNVLTDYYHHRTPTQHNALKEALSRVPTMVEVIRCKDCQNCIIDRYTDGNKPDYACKEWDSGVSENGYCYRGIEKDEIN